MNEVLIYDRVNPERLLGRLTKRPPLHKDHNHFHMPALSSLGMVGVGDPSQTAVAAPRIITFQRRFRPSTDGWSMEAYLVTDAPLSDLKWLREFTYPGETPRAAKERLYMEGYGG